MTTATKPVVRVERTYHPSVTCSFCPADHRDSGEVYVLSLIRETQEKSLFYEFRACARHLDRLASDLFRVSLERGGG